MQKLVGPNGPIWLKTATATEFETLSPHSNKKLTVVCPMCGKEWDAPKYSITKKGHTRCQPCQQRVSAYGDLIGRKVGRLTITGFGDPLPSKSGGNLTTVTAVCDCGNVITTLGQGIRDAIRNGHVCSCGCYTLERIRQQGRSNTGANNGMYRHDLTLTQRVARKKLIKRIKRTWAKAVRLRDGACVICGLTKGLEAHHLHNTVANPDLCLTPENGITVCAAHHQDFHCNFMGHVHTPTIPADFFAYLKTVHGWTDEQVQALISSKNLCRN